MKQRRKERFTTVIGPVSRVFLAAFLVVIAAATLLFIPQRSALAAAAPDLPVRSFTLHDDAQILDDAVVSSTLSQMRFHTDADLVILSFRATTPEDMAHEIVSVAHTSYPELVTEDGERFRNRLVVVAVDAVTGAIVAQVGENLTATPPDVERWVNSGSVVSQAGDATKGVIQASGTLAWHMERADPPMQDVGGKFVTTLGIPLVVLILVIVAVTWWYVQNRRRAASELTR